MQFSPDQLLMTTVHDKSGHKVGKVQQVYLDDATGAPSWVTVRTGIFGTNESLVPVENAELNGNLLHVPFDRQVIHDAPNFDPGHHLDESDEDELYRYYGMSPPLASTPRTTGQDQAGGKQDRDDQPGGERVEQPRTGSDERRRGGEEQVRPEQASGEYVSESAAAGTAEHRSESAEAKSTDPSQERELLQRERDLLERERDLLDRERELAEQEGSVRPRLRRHDPGNRS